MLLRSIYIEWIEMAIDYKDYYALLGLSKTASAEEIKRAYRRLAKVHHPDLHTEKNKAGATAKFKEINEAYEVLSDPKKKAQYDEIGPGWDSARPAGPEPRHREEAPDFGGEGGGFSGFSDFFENLYGRASQGRPNPRAGPRRGQDIEAEMPLSLEDAVAGGEKRLTLSVPALCPTCGGTGHSGQDFCRQCGGVGEIQTQKTITARLPKLVHDGMRIRLRGQGGAARGGGEAGDMFVTLRLQPHPLYKVSGSDLETHVTVMPWVAALGGEAVVASLDGPVRIKIPPGTHAGRMMRISGKGLGREDGKRGDLHAAVRIDIPEKSDARMEALYKQMRETSL